MELEPGMTKMKMVEAAHVLMYSTQLNPSPKQAGFIFDIFFIILLESKFSINNM